MDMQEYVAAIVKQQRNQRMRNSPQLTLGGLIAEIEKAGVMKDNGEPKSIEYDYGTAIPTSLDSWRGSYAELALGYQLTGYDNHTNHMKEVTAESVLKELKEAVGKEYDGWKGGEFTMNENTPIWVANPGNSGNTAVVGILDCRYKLVILTAYCEY